MEYKKTKKVCSDCKEEFITTCSEKCKKCVKKKLNKLQNNQCRHVYSDVGFARYQALGK